MSLYLTTRRLRLRPLERRDAAVIALLANDLKVTRMTSRMPYPYTRADADAFLDHLAEAVSEGRDHVCAIERRGILTGVIGLHKRPPATHFEMGYWLGQIWWGFGFATEAAAAMVAHAFEVMGEQAVIAGHHPDNAASGAVLAKAGFTYTGEEPMRPCVARGGDMPVRMMVLTRLAWEMKRAERELAAMRAA